jgi:hypothetical protein
MYEATSISEKKYELRNLEAGSLMDASLRADIKHTVGERMPV